MFAPHQQPIRAPRQDAYDLRCDYTERMEAEKARLTEDFIQACQQAALLNNLGLEVDFAPRMRDWSKPYPAQRKQTVRDILREALEANTENFDAALLALMRRESAPAAHAQALLARTWAELNAQVGDDD